MALFGNQVPFEELLQQRTQPSVHDQFGRNQQGERRQIADVDFHVEQEGDPNTAFQQPSFDCRKDEERQPGKCGDDDDPPADHQQRVVGKVRPAENLEERPAQDEREVLLNSSPGRVGAQCGRSGIHCRSPSEHADDETPSSTLKLALT